MNGCDGTAQGAVASECEVWEGNGFGLGLSDLVSKAWKGVDSSGEGVDVCDVVQS